MSTTPALARRRLAVAALVVALLAAVVAALATQVPRWIAPDGGEATALTFTTPQVSLSPVSVDTALALDDLTPGDVRVAPLTVRNDGPVAVTYAITSMTTEDALAGKVDLAIRSGVADCSPEGVEATGSVLVSRRGVGTVAGSVIADGLVLEAGASEVLCVQASLAPTWAGQDLGDTTTVATWRLVTASERPQG